MTTLELWGRASAFNVQKVLWLLDELQLPFRHTEIGGAAGGLDTPAFRALNPHGRVPVLRDGAVVVWESHSILRYLAATYGAGALWAASPAARSLAERWMDWAQTSLQPAFMDLFWGYYRTPAAQHDHAAITAAAVRCAGHFGALDAQLASQPYLAGADFTLGDIAVGAALYRYFEMGYPTPPLPAVRAWYARLGARASYRARVMQPFEALRGRGDFYFQGNAEPVAEIGE
jgi:glutathione S-transferase